MRIPTATYRIQFHAEFNFEQAQESEEGWFILTNLGSLEMAITAYKKRFGIEEMFRDFKKGGYNERRN